MGNGAAFATLLPFACAISQAVRRGKAVTGASGKMGRDASAAIRFQGQAGDGKLVLEADVLILRGAVKARIARDQITGFDVVADALRIMTDLGEVWAGLGAKEAALWCKALAKPVPTLAEKLGLSTKRRVCVIGALTDAALQQAVAGFAAPPAEAALFVAELPDEAALQDALALIATWPTASFWGVTQKGKSALGDAQLRAAMRAAGYIDSKSCSVSARLTATRYGRRG